jgi:hypothetical protein
MRRMNSGRFCTFALVALTSPAVATPPQSEQLVDIGLGALPTIDCGGFNLTYEMSGERARVTTYFDSAGTPIRMRVRWTIHGTLTHSLTGAVLRDQSALNITTDLNTGEQTVVGVGFHYTIPGEGVIFLDAGRVIFGSDGSIQFSAGPKDAINGFAPLCNALAS